MSTVRELGMQGEAEVAKLLRKQGYILLASRWRCRFGELDLVAKDSKGMICFVEVKLRSGGAIAAPREFVDQRKQTRLRTAAAAYLSQHQLEDVPARFDVAEVYWENNGSFRVEYLENAFA